MRGSLQMQSFAKRLVPRVGLDALVLAPDLKQLLCCNCRGRMDGHAHIRNDILSSRFGVWEVTSVGWESGLANPLNWHWTHQTGDNRGSHVAVFLKKAWGLEAMLEVREERNEELPAIDLRRISWPCQLMTSGDESWNTHPWVTLKKKIFFALHAEMLISDSQQETIGHRCLWESPAFALRDLGLRWCQPLGHCTSYLAYRN